MPDDFRRSFVKCHSVRECDGDSIFNIFGFCVHLVWRMRDIRYILATREHESGINIVILFATVHFIKHTQTFREFSQLCAIGESAE